jgi:H/ACA ribonucleoprotein complex subunit 2
VSLSPVFFFPSCFLPRAFKANNDPPAAKNNALKRGVKEVTKTIRKSSAGPVTSAAAPSPGIVVLAGDIFPLDVISHLPIACEDHNIPYIYVRSRAELGDSAATKRPTSVVMLTEKPGKKKQAKKGEEAKKDDDDDGDSYADKYKSLVKLVQEETLKQAFW